MFNSPDQALHPGRPRLSEPCPRCGWLYQGFHVCFDASKPCDAERLVKTKTTRTDKPKNGDARDSGRTARWEVTLAANAERNAKIVSEYEAGDGLRELAERYNLAHATMRKIILKAEQETGRSIMRPRGINARFRKSGDNDVQEADTGS